MKGVKDVVGVVTDAATGQVLGLNVLVERDADEFMEWLGDFARDCGVEAMVTDDLSAYKPVVERLGIDHQICTAHVRKRAWNRLAGIDGWDWIKARIWRLLTALPFDVDLELLRQERAVRDGDATLRRMRVELSGRAIASYCASRSIVRRYSKSQPALFRFAAIPIFSDFSLFARFSASRRSVDMFSAACPILITLPSSPNDTSSVQ